MTTPTHHTPFSAWQRALFRYAACTVFFAAIAVSQYQLIDKSTLILPLASMLAPALTQTARIVQLKEADTSEWHPLMSIVMGIAVLLVMSYFLYSDFVPTLTFLRAASAAMAIYFFVLTTTTLLIERIKKVTIFSSAKGYAFQRALSN